MFYVNGWRGVKEYRELSETPEGALMYYEDAIEKGYTEVTVKDKSGDRYEEYDLRKLIDRRLMP